MSLKLLVIDTNDAASAMMREAFRLKGADVHMAVDADTGLAMANKNLFDGIFIGMSAKDSNGVEIVQLLRQCSWNLKTPIVLLGRGARSQHLSQALRAGGSFFLPMPREKSGIVKVLNCTRNIMIEERRRYQRISLPMPIRCTVGVRELPHCLINNLSLSGMLLQADGSLKKRNGVDLYFKLDNISPSIELEGIVVRVDPLHRVGIRFVGMSPDIREHVKKRISKEVDSL
ncbi:MAG: hypothetical protein A3F68_04970 [Acidobacteria bacterium RIFCSPLOWO2_12_FULL_54_10]|nr:MAG: hypothetical protein A3F68_04970 [Acidobacteria bacterium RIFCSPLOWO2_12_FULL_54_10]